MEKMMSSNGLDHCLDVCSVHIQHDRGILGGWAQPQISSWPTFWLLWPFHMSELGNVGKRGGLWWARIHLIITNSCLDGKCTTFSPSSVSWENNNSLYTQNGLSLEMHMKKCPAVFIAVSVSNMWHQTRVWCVAKVWVKKQVKCDDTAQTCTVMAILVLLFPRVHLMSLGQQRVELPL